MKKYIIGLVLAGLIALLGLLSNRPIVTIYAQTLPITKTVTWDANPAADAVNQYDVWLDSGPHTVVLAVAPQPYTTSVTFTTGGLHTIRATATNFWGTSTETTLAVNVVVPAKPSGLRLQ